MRVLPALVLVLLLAPAAAAQPSAPLATLAIDVQPDHAERMTLTFEGLKTLTRYHGLCLPADARETRVYDAAGDVEYDARDENDRRVLSFVARSDRVSVDMTRPARDDAEDPLYSGDANFCVPTDSRVRIEVRVPEGFALFFVSDEGVLVSKREARVERSGPLHVFYAYEAPPAQGTVLVEEGPFRIFAAAERAEQAREVARFAAPAYAAALAEAGLDHPFDALRVLFLPETPFSWEAGHYNGHGFVTVKEDTLDPDPQTGYPYSTVKVLVHEAFHAASFPYGKGDVDDSLAWWLEGTARHAERQVDAVLPNGTRHCERSVAEAKCWSFDDRIERRQLDAAYDPSFTFDPRWEPSLPQTEDTRRFYYALSEFVVASWIDRHGEPAYRAAWDALAGAFERGEGCPCEEGWLIALLDDVRLFEPWADVKATDPPAFETLVGPHVKDEAALERELAAAANPLRGLGIPSPAWAALVALAVVAAARRR